MENNDVIILASSESEADCMSANAKTMGFNVENKRVWTGIVPPNSFEYVMPFVRISTAEYFTFRNANQLDFKDAVMFNCEMLSNFRTARTEHDAEGIEVLDEPRLDAAKYRDYLEAVKDTTEGMTALKVLDKAEELLDVYKVDMFVKVMFPDAPYFED